MKQSVPKIAFLAYFALGSFIFYHIYFAKKIIPGVSVGNIKVGGMHYEEAYKILDQKAGQAAQFTIKAQGGLYSAPGSNLEDVTVFENATFVVNPQELGLIYKPISSIEKAFEVGRTGNIFIDTKDKIAGLFKTLYIPAQYELNDAVLSSFFSNVKAEVNKPTLNAEFILNKNGVLEIVSEQTGQKADDQNLYTVVVKSFDNLDFSSKMFAVEIANPKVTQQHLLAVQPEVEKLIFKTFTLESPDNQSWTLTTPELLKFIEVKIKNGEPALSLNDSAFNLYVKTLTQEIERLPRGQVTSEQGNIVTKFILTEPGAEVDSQKLKKDFKSVFFGVGSKVDLTVNNISTLDNPAKYGIFALLGQGKSTYTGSGGSRVHNLTLAAQRTNGVLVPPGEIYSFNESVGLISGSTGYQTGYAISGGRTILADGGGVCHTSTTLFRAVLNAGLPIIERNPHQYRVGYYELDSPAGFDASIYQPYLDFKFMNDTSNYILVQSFHDAENEALIFKIYGTPDGREIEISTATLVGESAPPAPLYQNDPSLPKGVVRQVDFSAWGGTAEFNRIVKHDGKILFDDTFTTHYQPWRAIFLVGTKES